MDKWISVKERVPEGHEEVLALLGPRHLPVLATHVGPQRTFWRIGKEPTRGITHWMPILEPPEEPFYVSSPSVWPPGRREDCGVFHRTYGPVIDLEGRCIADELCARLNEIWTSDKGSTKDTQ